MIVIPSIDLWEKQVVRLKQGDFSQVKVYSKNPLEVAKEFFKNGLKRLHVVDLGGALKGSPEHKELIFQIKQETQLCLQVGGGIRHLQQVEEYFSTALNLKEDFIIIGSLPLENVVEFHKIRQKFSKNIILAVDVWGRQIKTKGWQKETQIEVFSFLQEMFSLGLRQFLVTQIQKDGMMQGPDFLLYQEILERFPEICLIASGGVRHKDDLIQLKNLGLYGAILGKAYYEKSLSLDELAQI